MVEAGSALPVALTEGFQTALMVGAGFAILGAMLAYLLVDGREVEENVDGDAGAGHDVAREGAPDGDLQRARLDPQTQLPWVEVDAGGGQCRLRSLAAVAGQLQARRVPPERADAGVLPVVPQRPVRAVEDVVEVRVAVQRLDRGAQRAERGVQVLDAVRQLGRGLAVERLLGGELASAAPRPRSRPPRTGSEPLKLRSASWQSRSASPAATGSTARPSARRSARR